MPADNRTTEETEDAEECPNCHSDIPIVLNFNTLGDDVECPNCKTKFVASYDETWDGEDECGYFWLERARSTP